MQTRETISFIPLVCKQDEKVEDPGHKRASARSLEAFSNIIVCSQDGEYFYSACAVQSDEI
jgi:hypothetical protein